MSWVVAGAVVLVLFVLALVVVGLLIRVVGKVADRTLNKGR